MPDTANHRIQVFNANGAFQRSFGSQGVGDTQFECPSGVAINPVNQDILVVDPCNQRVQIFSNAWQYKTTLGVTGVAGSSERHFNSPSGVAVNANGGNLGGQHQQLSGAEVPALLASDYASATFAGERGMISASFDHLHPVSVAVDPAGRVAVMDQRNNRVQVFDRQGNYQTTIAGVFGPQPGGLRQPMAAQFDQAGNLYVANQNNHRVQRYAPGTPAWTQWNLNGFGTPTNALVLSLASFNGPYYAGSDNASTGRRSLAQLQRRGGRLECAR